MLFPFTGDTVGGSHMSALELAGGLQRAQVEVVIGVHELGMLRAELDRRSIPWVKLPSIEYVRPRRKPRRLIREMLASQAVLYRTIKDLAVDIVHTNDRRMHMSWLLPAARAGTPHVWHQRSALKRQRDDWYMRFPARVVTISRFCRDSFPPRMRSRTTVVANPVTVEIPSEDQIEAVRTELLALGGAPDDAAVIGWVANWIAIKRPEMFVDVAARAAAMSEKPLVFAMFGEPRDDVSERVRERIRQAGLGQRLLVMGPRFPIEPWIAACDVLVATARNEGLGRTIIEAMLLGTPVVATADGGHLEIIDEGVTGRLVSLDDVELFAIEVLRLLNEPTRAMSVARAARKYAQEAFTLEGHTETMLDIYQQSRVDRKTRRRRPKACHR